ncbi:lipase member H-B-like [Maniola hyperantus]|uniref:lipase member H-B-like n=1 Tax=Aphantopus hyperantus TaxID=2795564 RepID=UPI001569791F|nr:lipase member H-B-like [Maniola hyperantus]
MFLYSFCLLLLTGNGLATYSTREMEGYPKGYLSDCPGSEKEAYITRKSLRHLSLYVPDSTGALRRKYNYYQMAQLAKDPDLDFNKKTLLYVGGFLDSPSFIFATLTARTYLSLGYNVLLLDTNWFTTMEYPRAARFMRPVGKHTAKMLVQLTNSGLDPKKLEIIGLSLGGQTISFIAKNYRDLTNTTVSRITGLDPAGPCFRNLGPDQRIDRSDADFVDIVSTNIDGFGMAAPVGHVNFYVNGGEFQPGDIIWDFCTVMCSHIRSYSLWMSALQNPNSFIAIECSSVQQARDKKCFGRTPLVTNVFGLKVNKSREGIFYLSTSRSYPYYLGEKGLREENDFFLSYTKSLNEKDVIKI